MKLLRYILIPFVPIYCFISWSRNKMYDWGWFSSRSYDLPIICVGNLSVGGTGKSPMIEYLIKLLQNNYKVATLSRGYKRQTTGFLLAEGNTTPDMIGDEPFQFFKKFENILVSVDANRQEGISRLMELMKKPDVILLDDAFQHRKVKAGLNILLTTYNHLYTNDICLPTGNLREPRSGAKRADIIVVTKCPSTMDLQEKNAIKKKLNVRSKQLVFFSTIKYSATIYSKTDAITLSSIRSKPFTLVTGIANAKPLIDYLNKEGFNFEHLNYGDHHNFSETEAANLNKKDRILTTEKDYWRLYNKLGDVGLYYLPIETQIFDSDMFNSTVLNSVSGN